MNKFRYEGMQIVPIALFFIFKENFELNTKLFSVL